MSAILTLKNVSKSLSKKLILKNISFEVEEWEIYGFLWPNGAWKTTTMKTIMWLIEPDDGAISVFGTPGLLLEDKKQVGFMPENTYLYKHLTWREFLRFNGKFFWLKGEELEWRVQELLERVDLAKNEDWDKYLHAYSKWMLQRVGLAQSIINKPKLLFLDEPMSGLDPVGRKDVKDLLVELNKNGTTIFFNTHILADVESICSRIAIIHNGEIIVEWKKISDIKWNLEDYFIEKVTAESK